MSEKFYVTTPIYYVNDSPHIGHAYTTIAADVLARYHRARGDEVRFLTGTDEHGIKIVKAAAQRGLTPRQLADEVVVHFQDLWRELNISHDDFIRTTEPRHEQRVREVMRRLLQRGQIYQGVYRGWYDEGQEEFVTESVARENDYKSPINGRPLVRYEEPGYFFRLSQYVPALVEHIRSHEEFIQPASRRNEVLSKLAQGVEDLNVSRSAARLNGWGVPMPDDESQMIYVWVDALSNYVTALGHPPVGQEGDDALWDFWGSCLHLIGKDILWFHTVYWPCLLLALGEPPPRSVFAHGWWTSEGKKMSKSLGNFISREVILDLCGQYSRDAFRYFLLREVPFGADGDFSRDALRRRYNSELANDVGNLLSRTVSMIRRYFDGRIPDPPRRELTGPEEDACLVGPLKRLQDDAPAAMNACRFSDYLRAVMDLVTGANRYIDATQPFGLAKDPARRQRLSEVLYACAEAVRIVLCHLGPFMPDKAVEGLRQLGADGDSGTLSEQARFGRLVPGACAPGGGALFPRKP